MSESIDPSVSVEPSYSKGSQIETGLALARVLSDARDARRKEAMLSRAGPLNRPQVQAAQRALQNLLASYLTRTGFEVEKYDAICEQLQAEQRVFLEEQKAEAVKDSARVNESLRRSVDRIYQAFNQLLEPPKELLDTPILIWQTQGIHFPDTQVEPGSSRAKFVLNPGSDSVGDEELSFYFLWQNPSDRFVVVNVDSSLVLNGVCMARTGGGLFLLGIPFEVSFLRLGANLFLYEPPFTAPLEPAAADKRLVENFIAVTRGWPVAIGGIDSNHVRTIAQLHVGPFPVAPHAFTMFEVTVSMEFVTSDGEVTVDFDKGDFQVMCPGVVITILS